MVDLSLDVLVLLGDLAALNIQTFQGFADSGQLLLHRLEGGNDHILVPWEGITHQVAPVVPVDSNGAVMTNQLLTCLTVQI